MLSPVLFLTAQNRTDKGKVQRQKQETTKRLKQSAKQFEINKAETAKRLKELSLVEGEIVAKNKEIKAREKSIDSLQTIIENVTDTIHQLNARLNDLSSKYASALRRQQGSYQSPSTLSYLFASKTVSQAMRRFRALKQFSKWRARKADEINELKGKLEVRQNELAKLKTAHTSLLEALTTQKQELAQSKVENEKLIEGLKAKSKEIKAVMDESKKELDQLDKQLEKLIAEEQARLAEQRRKEEETRKKAAEEAARLAEEQRQAQLKQAEEERKAEEKRQAQEKKAQEKAKKEQEKNNKQAKKSGKKTAETASDSKNSQTIKAGNKTTQTSIGNITARSAAELSKGFEAAKGKLPYPVDGKHVIVRSFGRQQHPDLPMIETDNPGIDISVGNNEKARAVYEGEVSAIFKQPGFNNVIMVRHGDFITIYANLVDIEVKKGDRIGAGTSLGKVAVDDDDSKGRSILHFEIRREKEKENPQLWLR